MNANAAVDEWAGLGTAIQPQNTSKRKGQITVSEGFSPNWLGIAQIFVEGGHITKGTVKLNTTFLNSYGAFVADHVLCQELGHILGLTHNVSVTDTCMNDGGAATSQAEWLAILNATGSDSPNAHDTEELNASYAHASTEAGTGGSGGGPGNKGGGGKGKNKEGRWVTIHVFPVPD